jgi:hypothetical protein
MSTRRCSAGGAAVELAEGARSTTCAFCDSALVDVPPVDGGSGAAEADPVDRVVPFVLDRGRAGRALASHLAAHWFAPESVRRATRPEELRDVLVPFWAWDATARSSFSARVGIWWYRTETYTVTVNGKTETRTRQVRETDWHPLSGSHARQWTNHLVSASRGLAEAEANALEPFDLGRSLPFAPALLAGIPAERPTVGRAEAEPLARQELADREREAIAARHLPGDVHADLHSETVADLAPPRLVLLPVWIAAYRGPNGAIRMLVNGQTGEVVGHVPRSGWKVAAVVVAVLGALFGVLAVVFFGGSVLALIGAAS